MTTRRRAVRDRKAWRRFRRSRGLRKVALWSMRLEADIRGMCGALVSVMCAFRDLAAALSSSLEIPANPTASSGYCDKHCDTGPTGPEVTNA